MLKSLYHTIISIVITTLLTILIYDYNLITISITTIYSYCYHINAIIVL